MNELEKYALKDPMFIDWIKKTFQNNCRPCVFQDIWNYIKNNFEYIDDKYDEVIINPAKLLKIRRGDCDDFSLFIKTVLSVLKIPAKYILFGYKPGVPTHVAVWVPGYNTLIDGASDLFNYIPKEKYKYFRLVK